MSVLSIPSKVSNVKLAGIAAAVPKNIVSNDYFEAFFESTDIESVSKMSGVKTRRWVDENTTTGDLCYQSALKLLRELGWDPSTIDGLIFISQTPDFLLPATAMHLHKKLEMKTAAIAFDVNLGCSGYPYGLWLASLMLQSDDVNRVLVLAGDTISKVVDPHDRATAMLFGDAGSATALEYSDKQVSWSFVMGTDGNGVDNLVIPDSGFIKNFMARDKRLNDKKSDRLFMDGTEIFNFTLKTVPPLVSHLVNEYGIDVGRFYFHQANLFMINHLRKKMKVPESAVPTNIDLFGNTSVASIPLLFATDNLCKDEVDHIAMAGFGVGYSWSAVAMPVDNDTKRIFLEV